MITNNLAWLDCSTIITNGAAFQGQTIALEYFTGYVIEYHMTSFALSSACFLLLYEIRLCVLVRDHLDTPRVNSIDFWSVNIVFMKWANSVTTNSLYLSSSPCMQSYKFYLSTHYGEPIPTTRVRLYERTSIRRSKLMNNLAVPKWCQDSNLIPPGLQLLPESSILLMMIRAYWSKLRVDLQFLSELITTQLRISHGVTANSLILNFSG